MLSQNKESVIGRYLKRNMLHKVLATVLRTLKKRNGKTERKKKTVFSQIKAVTFYSLFFVDVAL